MAELAMLAGEIMLKNGAETYRVEDTINRILGQSGLSTVEAFVITTGIVITLDDPSIEAITMVRRVSSRSTDLSKIASVNEISRKLCNKEFEAEEAYSRLLQIANEKKEYNVYIYSLGIVFIVAGCAIMFGGTAKSMLLAIFIGICEVIALLVTKRLNMNQFISDTLVALVTAAFIMICKNIGLIGSDLNLLISASIMPLVPGVAITNAVRDTLCGDYISGAARILEAFVTATAVAIGVGAGLTIINLFTGVKLSKGLFMSVLKCGGFFI